MAYDLLIVIILLAWSISRIIQKEIIKSPSSAEFSKWTILLSTLFAIPILPFVKFSSLNIMFGILIVSFLWIYEQFFKFMAIKKEEVSRVMSLIHFKFFFAVILAILFLVEPSTPGIIVGSILMVCGGIFVGLEKNFFKKTKVSNLSLLIFLSAMFASGIGYFIRKYLLEFTDPFSLFFFSSIFATILILPTIKKKPKFPKFKWMFLTQALMSYGYLAFLWILSRQDLVLTVPILAIQPVIILFLSKKFLKESQEYFFMRLSSIIVIILGYLILKGFIF